MHAYIPLGFAATELVHLRAGLVSVGNQSVSAEVDLATGEVRAGGPRLVPRAFPDLQSSLGAVIEHGLETTEGPLTELADGGRVHRFGGEVRHGLRAPGGGALVAVIAATPTARGTRTELVAVSLSSGEVMRLPGHWASRVAGGPGIVAASVPGAVHIVQAAVDGDRLAAVTVPLAPSSRPAQLVVDGAAVVALAGSVALVIDTRELPREAGHRTLGLTYLARRARGASSAEPAVVVFVMADKVLVDHPTLKRLTLPRAAGSPVVHKGERVLVDDVREELPGLYRVHAWRRADDPAATTADVAPYTLPAPVLPAMDDEGPVAAPRVRQGEVLESLARTHGVVVPELVLRWLGHVDGDPVFRRWCSKLGLESIEVRSLVPDWDADPSLLAFAGIGNGDEHCLYLHPDAPPGTVVTFCHETNTIDGAPRSFEAWMDALLAEREDGGDEVLADLAARVRARLALPRGPSHPPVALEAQPRWWQAAARVGELGDVALASQRAREALAAGRPRDAEPWMLACYLAADGAAVRRAELRALYEALGWSLQVAMLASRDG